MPLINDVMTRSEARAMLRSCQQYRTQMRRQAADTKLPFNLRYAAAVYVDSWEEQIEDDRAYLKMPGLRD